MDMGESASATPPTSAPPFAITTLTEDSALLSTGEIGMGYGITGQGTAAAADDIEVALAGPMPRAQRIR